MGDTAAGGDSDDRRPVVNQDDEQDTVSYEVAGGVLAGLGFLMTPLVTGIPAAYCALKVRDDNPVAYYLILATIAGTGLVWLLFIFARDIVALFTQTVVSGSLLVVLLGVPVAVFLVGLAGATYLLLR